ncbi:hypothetical protein [Nocardia mexicana]|nr:hypothetical protein [Nocardia mexicana]
MFDNHRRLERRMERIERKLDAIMRHLQIADPLPPPVAPNQPVVDGFRMAEVDELLTQGKKIQAIKVYRELYPETSLKQAKDAVEARERGYR